MEKSRVPYELLCDGLGGGDAPDVVMKEGIPHFISNFVQENREVITVVGITAVGFAVGAALHSFGHKDQVITPQTEPLSV